MWMKIQSDSLKYLGHTGLTQQAVGRVDAHLRRTAAPQKVSYIMVMVELLSIIELEESDKVNNLQLKTKQVFCVANNADRLHI